jgi:hypothetical protein
MHKLISSSPRLIAMIRGTDLSGSNLLGIDPDHVCAAFDAYAHSFDLMDPPLSRKYSHSMRVALDALLIARGEDGADEGACFLAGLLHDVGRFPQHAMHKSFSDGLTVDHARLGFLMLGEMGMLGRFVEMDGICSRRGEVERLWDGAVTASAWRIGCNCDLAETREGKLAGAVLEAVRVHNMYAIPGDLDGESRKYAAILRDADKIDILEELASGIIPHDSYFADNASDAVLASMAERRQIDTRDVENAADEMLKPFAMAAYGMETRTGRSILADRHVLSDLLGTVEFADPLAQDAAAEASSLSSDSLPA